MWLTHLYLPLPNTSQILSVTQKFAIFMVSFLWTFTGFYYLWSGRYFWKVEIDVICKSKRKDTETHNFFYFARNLQTQLVENIIIIITDIITILLCYYNFYYWLLFGKDHIITMYISRLFQQYGPKYNFKYGIISNCMLYYYCNTSKRKQTVTM